MKIKLLLSATLLAVCGIASAQTAVEITDPAKIAEIERHAAQLGAQPMASGNMQGDGMHGDRRHMREHRKHMNKMRHHKMMHGNRAAMKTPPDVAAPASPPPAQ